MAQGRIQETRDEVLLTTLGSTSTCEALLLILLLILLRTPAGIHVLPAGVERMLLIRLLALAAPVGARGLGTVPRRQVVCSPFSICRRALHPLSSRAVASRAAVIGGGMDT